MCGTFALGGEILLPVASVPLLLVLSMEQWETKSGALEGLGEQSEKAGELL